MAQRTKTACASVSPNEKTEAMAPSTISPTVIAVVQPIGRGALSSSHRAQVVQLLGRRCSAKGSASRRSLHGRVLVPAATDTLAPLVHLLLCGVLPSNGALRVTLGLRAKPRVLDDATVRMLDVTLLMVLDADAKTVIGAALLTKSAPRAGLPGFVVTQLVAVHEKVEGHGIGSVLLEASCAVAVAYDPSGSLVVPACAMRGNPTQARRTLSCIGD